MFGGNANPGVLDAQRGPAGLPHYGHTHSAAWTRIAQRVVNQVDHQLRQTGLISQDQDLLLHVLVQLDATLDRQRLHRLRHAPDQLAKVELLACQELLAGVGAGQGQQLAD